MSRIEQPGVTPLAINPYPAMGTTMPPAGTFAEQRPEHGTLENIRERAGEWASEATHRAEHLWDTTRREAGVWGRRAADEAEVLAGRSEAFMRRYPIPSMLGVFGMGCILGYALRRVL